MNPEYKGKPMQDETRYFFRVKFNGELYDVQTTAEKTVVGSIITMLRYNGKCDIEILGKVIESMGYKVAIAKQDYYDFEL